MNDETELNHNDYADREKIIQGKAAGLANYIELQHEEYVESLADFYAVLDRVKIRRDKGFTCPLKTVALFASNEEFSLLPRELPELVKTVMTGCRTRQDVEMLARNGSLPSIATDKAKSATTLSATADIICFDTRA